MWKQIEIYPRYFQLYQWTIKTLFVSRVRTNEAIRIWSTRQLKDSLQRSLSHFSISFLNKHCLTNSASTAGPPSSDWYPLLTTVYFPKFLLWTIVRLQIYYFEGTIFNRHNINVLCITLYWEIRVSLLVYGKLMPQRRGAVRDPGTNPQNKSAGFAYHNSFIVNRRSRR